MATDNIKDYTLTWVTAGLILFALLTFVIIFVYNNNPSALGENEAQLEILHNNLSNSLTEVESDVNLKMNVSAQLNSEEGTLGSESATSTSYGFAKTSNEQLTIMKSMIAWVFAGTFGQLIIKILSGIAGLTVLYYIIKLIRSLF